MSKICKKRAIKLKEMESQNSSLTAQLEELHAKVSQLEDHDIILSNNLIVAGKESELLKQQELKAKSEMNNLKKELSDCKAEKEDLRGKLKMALTELDSATASIKRMNTGSKKLDQTLGSQRLTSLNLELATLMELRLQKIKVNLYLVEDSLFME